MFHELTRARSRECLSDLQLDAWSSEELDGAASAQAQAHVDSCARCTERHNRMQREREAFLLARPSSPVARSADNSNMLSDLAKPKPKQRWARSGTVLSVMAAAAALLLLRVEKNPGTEMVASTRMKGS